MDRFVVREPRVSDFSQGNQILAYGRANNGIPIGTHYNAEIQNMHQMNQPLYLAAPVHTQGFNPNLPGQGQVVSGIDPLYLAAYADTNAGFIATGQQIQRERCTILTNPPFGDDYQNRNVASTAAPERNLPKPFTPMKPKATAQKVINSNNYKSPQDTMQTPQHICQPSKEITAVSPKVNSFHSYQPYVTEAPVQSPSNAPVKKLENPDMHKSESQNQVMSRSDKLKALHKSGTRVFSGPVEKVLKWHKALQEIGVFVLYEIVAKCVSVRPGESCAKNLVVRDENGPAMQIVYYEVDFLLPELNPPRTIRVIGKMMAGTSRFQAFNVRTATGDDVATLPRRAAVAAHHVAKLCKEYGS